MQVDQGLLQPSCEQSGSLRGLAFIQKTQQRGRLVEATLWTRKSMRTQRLL